MSLNRAELNAFWRPLRRWVAGHPKSNICLGFDFMTEADWEQIPGVLPHVNVLGIMAPDRRAARVAQELFAERAAYDPAWSKVRAVAADDPQYDNYFAAIFKQDSA